MAEYMWPADVLPNYSEFKFIDSTVRSESVFNGYTRTMVRPGQKARLSLRFEKLRDADRKRMMGLITSLRGASGRLIMHDCTHVQSGVFASSELMPSSTFLNGTTGLTAGPSYTLTAINRAIRAKRSLQDGGAASVVRPTSALTVTAGYPYIGRVLVERPDQVDDTDFTLKFGSTSFGGEYVSQAGFASGMMQAVVVPPPGASTLHFSLVQTAGAGDMLNDYFDIPFMSVSQCALIDNGPNYFTYSSDPNNAAWTKTRSSINNNSITLPDGSTSTTATLKEDATASNTHYMSETVTIPATTSIDVMIAIAVSPLNRSWIQLRLEEMTGNGVASAYFNSSSGAVGTTSAGTNWSNLRTSVGALSNGWYVFYLIATKTNAATSVEGRFSIASADNTNSFTGLDQNSLAIWRPTLAISSVPCRLTGTSATAYPTGQAQAQGDAQYIKGLLASTANLLAAGDQVEINGRIYWAKRQVDSTVCGLAKLRTSPVQRAAPADNDPVIVNRPHGRFFMEPIETGWETKPPGFLSDVELVLMEAA